MAVPFPGLRGEAADNADLLAAVALLGLVVLDPPPSWTAGIDPGAFRADTFGPFFRGKLPCDRPCAVVAVDWPTRPQPRSTQAPPRRSEGDVMDLSLSTRRQPPDVVRAERNERLNVEPLKLAVSGLAGLASTR